MTQSVRARIDAGGDAGAGTDTDADTDTDTDIGTDSGTDIGTDTGHLWDRMRRVERRVRHVVAERRAVDPDPNDPYRGQYLSPEAVERILDRPSAFFSAAPDDGSPPPEPPPGSRIQLLVESFGLTPLDVELLLIALAPDLDARFERFYGYLNDDLFRCRPTVGLALELCGLPAAGAGRFRFSPAAPLVAGGLVDVMEGERPLLSRVLRVPDRVAAHLLGDDEIDAGLGDVVTVGRATGEPFDAAALRAADAVGTGSGLVYLADRGGDAGGQAVEALAVAGRPALVVDIAALNGAAAPAELLRAVVMEARLRGAGIVLGPLETLEPERPERGRMLRGLCASAAGIPLVAHGTKGWDSQWAAESPVTVAVVPPDPDQRVRQWRRALADAAASMGVAGALDVVAPIGVADTPDDAAASLEKADASRAGRSPDNAPHPYDQEYGGAPVEAVAGYRLDAEQIRRAAGVATRTAVVERRPVGAEDLRAAIRAQNGAGLARLARRVEPAVGWADLVLPEVTRRQLDELALRARHRDQVLGRWGMRPGGGRGRGVTALFAGESGTGKTMSAEVVAAELGMDLYVVDLSTVVDKYIGETEKNLERIFREASEVNGVLLFDEADAIFGKRSQVKDAHDRHANVESAYLLQRMESFDGIAVLTTNLRANLDEAFTRRLDVIADFPMPDADQRLALWDRCLGPELPRADGLDLPFCAERFELSGGSIRACAVTAAYLTAEAGRPLSMDQLMAALLQEYRKLGRLVLESEFGPWFSER